MLELDGDIDENSPRYHHERFVEAMKRYALPQRRTISSGLSRSLSFSMVQLNYCLLTR